MSEPTHPNQHNESASPPKASQKKVRVLLGRIVATPNALAQVPIVEIHQALARHVQGDWGDLDKEDQGRNNAALRDGERLLSAYTTTTGRKYWIITEATREITTILMPEDY